MIDVHGLTKRYDTRIAVDQLDLNVEAGEIYGLVGPDGAGKTTTFRLLVGALRLDGGGGRVAGYDLLTEIEQLRAQIGYLPQRFSLYGDLTVEENLRFFAEVNGLTTRDWQPRRDEMLAFVGLSRFAARRADQLSGGMKQKLGLATALIHRPRLLLLDEPTGGVDPVTRQDFWQLIGRVVRLEGVTVLVSTPYMDEASRCTRVGFLRRGRLHAEGSVAQLVQGLSGRTLELVGSPTALVRQLTSADPDVESVQPFGYKLHVRLRAGSNDAIFNRLPSALTAAGATVERLTAVAPTLEDAFIELLDNDDETRN
jgi:ABC-2 type transport system ATP-binding protein